MRNLRETVSCLVFAALFAVPADVKAGCGCEETVRPCEEETLATAAVHQAVPVPEGRVMEISVCADCGGSGEWAGGFVMSLLLLPVVIGIRAFFRRRNALIVARLDRLSIGSAVVQACGSSDAPSRFSPLPLRALCEPATCPAH